jgi:cytochrome c oxidase subunit 3
LKNNIIRSQYQAFPYHLVDPSPWPILVAFSVFSMAIGAVMYFHGFLYGGYLLSLGFVITIYGMILWFRDVISEGTLLGWHTKEVKSGLIIGVVLFIISEIFAFLSIFWAFFHSSLSPAIEIGGTWPPMGITPLDAFAIPLLNTFLLLSSGAFVTYGHHALIAGNRKGAIIGTILTIIFAILFTGLQYFEYCEAAFTMSDSVYGSAFFASTGLHGLIFTVPTKFIKKYNCKIKKIQFLSRIKIRRLNTISTKTKNNLTTDKLLIQFSPFGKKIKTFYLESYFLEWLSGFTDGEGNFNISLRNLNNDKYNSVILTYQIGLHIDDLNLLQFIKIKLNCGHISISGSRCNYFVNDQASLIHIILPIFNFVKLNSSKYYQYIIFEKAINLIKNKKHLSSEGKLEMIKYYHEIKIPSIAPQELNNLPLTNN